MDLGSSLRAIRKYTLLLPKLGQEIKKRKKLQATSCKLDKALDLGYSGIMSSRTVKPEFQPDGSKRQHVLDKAVRYILDKNPKLGTQNSKHAFLVEQVGLSQTEYLEALNRATNGGVVKSALWN